MFTTRSICCTIKLQNSFNAIASRNIMAERTFLLIHKSRESPPSPLTHSLHYYTDPRRRIWNLNYSSSLVSEVLIQFAFLSIFLFFLLSWPGFCYSAFPTPCWLVHSTHNYPSYLVERKKEIWLRALELHRIFLHVHISRVREQNKIFLRRLLNDLLAICPPSSFCY